MISHRVAWFALLIALACFLMPEQSLHAAKKVASPRRYTFAIDEKAPLKDLLPTPPKTPRPAPVLNEDLTLVPELMFGEPMSKDEKDTEKAMAHVIAKINHLNRKNPDGFIETLLAHRADLRGLPFRMGKDCRSDDKHARLFGEVVNETQHALAQIHEEQRVTGLVAEQEKGTSKIESVPDEAAWAKTFWKRLDIALVRSKFDVDSFLNKAAQPEIDRATVAAMMQMHGPRGEPYRINMIPFLAKIKHADAARALAQLALFSPEDAVRAAAIDALKPRPAKDYSDVLLQGFRYPLPALSQRAADALVKTQNKDVLVDLVNVLEQPDPRAPAKQSIDGKESVAVRELVRVNHHRNCLLCHAPANVGGVSRHVLTVGVPLPDEALQSAGGYGGNSPDIFVRTDVTYLRQDFSMMMKVENAKPWPEMQRFDFFVRTRELSAEEATVIEKALAGTSPPSHAAAHYALRKLTGRAPQEFSAQAWRMLLNLSK